MDYLGIFLYDLDVTLIILAILTTLRIVEFMYPTPRLPFFAYLHVRYVKATFYEICLALFIQNFHSLRTTEKSLVLTFSWVGSILIFLVYLTTIIISLRAVLSFDRIEYLIFEQVKDTDTIVKVMSLVPSMRRRMVYYQVPNYNYQSLS
jgi:hypothetical protein